MADSSLKRKAMDVGDACDRASRLRRKGMQRIKLDLLWFLPSNRGGLGVMPLHTHEVARDILLHKVSLKRYQNVEVVKLTPAMQAIVLKANQRLCDSNPLLPTCGKNIQFGILTKTHFTFATKLALDGGRTLFDDGHMAIKFQTGDEEGQFILQDGPLCVVYEADLLEDAEAMGAVMTEDNLNADVQHGEEEIQAFGRVGLIYEHVVADRDSKTDAPV